MGPKGHTYAPSRKKIALFLVFVFCVQFIHDQIIDSLKFRFIIDGAEDVQRKSPLELFDELYELQNNQPMSDEQRGFVGELIESIWEGSV